jgi:hypothetical protein
MKIIVRQIKYSIIFFLVYNLIYILKRNFFPGKIIFYEANLLLLILILICLLVSLYKKYETGFILPAYLSTLLFISLVPTIIDRSVSITVLGSIAKNQHGISMDSLKSDFIQIYVIKKDAVSKRIDEQLNSKNIKLENKNFLLTKKGKIVVFSIINFTKLYNIDTCYILQK